MITIRVKKGSTEIEYSEDRQWAFGAVKELIKELVEHIDRLNDEVSDDGLCK